MDLTDIIYSNDYINILIQNYVAQSERYQMLFPESSALLTLNSQYSVLFLERSLLPENLFGEILFTGLPKLFTPLSTLSLEVSGIVQTQNLYGGGYTGKNVIFGSQESRLRSAGGSPPWSESLRSAVCSKEHRCRNSTDTGTAES